MKPLLLCLSLFSAAGCAGTSGPMPMSLVGGYSVEIEANGKKDTDAMNVAVGSNNGVLLNFVYGISQIRCSLTSASGLSITRQVLHVSHSTGVADGTASGIGSIDEAGNVDITLDLATPGIDPPDGGPRDGGTTVTYTITGTRN